MSGWAVRIVADDLTGALDAAGAFATTDDPVAVPLGEPAASLPARIAIDTDSRDLDAASARARVARLFAGLTDAWDGLVFKKLDSVMRGHPVAEAVAAYSAGGFDRALLAPAFPAMGRITRGGRQHVVATGREEPVGPSLPEALRAEGVPAAMLEDAGPSPTGFLVADATEQAQLAAAVAHMARQPGRTLHVGSAGLAEALAGPARQLAVPPIELAICGTAHPVTRRQVESLTPRGIAVLPLLDAEGPAATGRPLALVAPATGLAAKAAERLLAPAIAGLAARLAPPKAALVTGGWTLRALLESCEALRLDCIGLHSPGLPVSRVVGGSWDGVLVVSKSGGFGADDLLARLFAGG